MANSQGADMNTDDPLAGLSAENREIILRQARGLRSEGKAQRIANADPLPGALAAAFAGTATIGGLQVRKLVHYDFVLLKRMNSPLLAQLSGKGGKKKGTPFTDDQGYEMIWQFTRPCEVVEGALNKLGVSGFRAMAKREIGLTLGPMETMLLVKAVEGEFVRSFSTCLKHGAPEKEGGGETVFTGPAMKPATNASLWRRMRACT